MRIFLFTISFLAGLQSHSQSGFVEFTDSLGLAHAQGSNGISVCDYDNDGDYDFYVSASQEENLLFENQGDSIFVDMAPLLGLDLNEFSRASIWADFDNDGWDDLFVGNYLDDSYLFKNNGDGSFTDVSNTAGLIQGSFPNSLNAVDINLDGLLDLYVANINSPNFLYINQGDFLFTEEVLAYGITDNLTAMGALFFDYDMDNDVDLYLTHDGYQEFILYRNNGNGTFTDVSVESNTNLARQGMGVNIADYDLDGDMDIYLANLLANDLLRNNGDGTFTNITMEAGVGDFGMSWGTFFLDYDNDTDEDIFINNMYYMGNFSNLLYRNNGDGSYTDIIEEGEAMESLMGGYGAASFDFNRNGGIDLLLANTSSNDENQIFINENSRGNWIQLELEGTISNRNAIGTKLQVFSDSLLLIDEMVGGSGYCSQNMAAKHFGLATRTTVDSIAVIWPNGLEETYYDLEINTHYLITENTGISLLDYAPQEEEEEEEEEKDDDDDDDDDELVGIEIEIINPNSDFTHFEYSEEVFMEETPSENTVKENNLTASSVVPYPNPSTKWITWNVPFTGDFKLVITDITGKEVFTESFSNALSKTVKVDINSFNSSSSNFTYHFIVGGKIISGTFFVLK